MKRSCVFAAGIVCPVIITALSLNASAADNKSDRASELDAIIEQAKTLGIDKSDGCETDLQIASQPLRLSMSIQVPVDIGNTEATNMVRNNLYATAAGECELISRHIPGKCTITNFKIQQRINSRRKVAVQDQTGILSANINYEITHKIVSSDCNK